MKSYKTYLRAIGRRPIPANLRTIKAPGDLELTPYEIYRHPGLTSTSGFITQPVTE